MKRKSRHNKSTFVYEELEPRVLLSADPMAVVTDAGADSVHEFVLSDNEHEQILQHKTDQFDQQQDQHKRSELVIIDSRAPNYQQLHNDVIKAQQQGRNIHVVILDAHRDGVEQISEALASFNQLDAVHIVSHGDDGQLQLGATQLNKSNLREHASDISRWKEAFSDDGDLLIYGCSLAETADGKSMVDVLGYLTATDAAASDDLTGNRLLGGDWELEYEVGDIETEIAFSEQLQDDWQGTLDAAAQAAAEEQQAEQEQQQQQQEQQAQADLEAQQAALKEEEQAAAKQEEGDQQAAVTQEQRQEIVIIDESVTDFQTFIDDLQANSDAATKFEIVLLDDNSDGVERINEILSEYQLVDALHIISHGDDGTVKLGNTWLDAGNLDQYSDNLSAWGDALDINADLLIYGCNLAESAQGEQFIDQLAQLTGADVAASDDPTGHESLGGDWDLEYQAGDIEAAVVPSAELQAGYEHILAVINGTAGDDALAGTAGDDVISAGAGNDVLVGVGGSDQLLGEAGNDVFRFTNAKDGDVYTVDGGSESDTIDLTEFGSGTVSDDGSTITVDLGDGKSFTINYSNIETVVTADTAGNHGPDADAGPDQRVAENTTVTLDASASDDFDGDALTWSWTQIGGPAVTLSNSTVAQPTFTSPTVASKTTLTFEVVVSDGTTSHVDTVEVTVLPAVDGTGGADSLTGTADGEVLRGLAGNDTLDGAGGDDILAGGLGDDALTGGAGTDIADYSDAGSGVTIDLTLTTAQNTGGGGTDTLSGIEGVVGSSSTDTFLFSNPQDGAVYSVDGNGGLNNTIDLSGYASTAATFGDGTLTVDMGGGQSFSIQYVDISLINFSDITANVLTNDILVANWSGSALLIDGDEAFRLDLGGGGTIDWSYDLGSDTLSITDTNGTGAGTALAVEDLNGNDLRIDQVAIDRNLGSLTSNADIDAINITGGDFTISTITVDSGAGQIGSFTTTATIITPTTINADIDSVTLLDVDATIDFNGDVGSIDVGKVTFDMHITGSVGPITMTGDLSATLQVDGNMTSLVMNKMQPEGSLIVGGDVGLLDTFDVSGPVSITGNLDTWNPGKTSAAAPITIGGDVGTITSSDGLEADLTIGGDLGSLSFASIASGVTVTANQVVGTLVFDVGGTDYGGAYAVPVQYIYNGTTGASVIYPEVPVQLNNTGLTVDEGSTTVITNSHLNFGDAQQPAASVTYTVTALPTNGQLELTTNPNVAITSFTQDDIDNSRVVYVHDGSETTADSFGFTVDDGQDNYASGPSILGISTLTNVTSGISNARAPDYSPDGSKIVFARNNDIYIMDADGSNQTPLVTDAGGDFQAVWSPDGSNIAFTSNRDGNNEIYVIDVDGSNETRITSHAASDSAPAWSPDSSKIAFTSDRDGDKEIWVMDADGTNLVQLTSNTSVDGGASWSPDGSKIVFQSTRDAGDYEIYVMDTDGSNQTRLTSDLGIDALGDWSPDGSKLLFYSERDGNREIYVMDADGSNQIRLTNDAGIDMEAEWSPDGSHILFSSDRDGDYDVYSASVMYENTFAITVTAVNDDPVITSDGGSATASVNVVENTTAVTTVTATDLDGDTITYSISGGADAALFSIDANTGELRFITAPDFENPADSDGNGVYEVEVTTSDGNGGTDTQTINVAVTDANDAPAFIEDGVGYWQFDEGSGTTTGDSTYGTSTGTLGSTAGVDSNDPIWTTGKFGQALQFDGVDDYVEIADAPELDISGPEFSASFWMKPDSGPNQEDMLFMKGDRQGNINYYLSWKDSGKMTWAFKDSAGWHYLDMDVTLPTVNEWNHVSIVFDRPSVSLYINGTEYTYNNVATGGSMDRDLTANDEVLWIGAGRSGGSLVGVNQWSGPFSGAIDELAIYDRALTAAEIETIRTSQPAAATASRFTIDENTATSTVIGTVAASDPDAGDTLSYSITGGNTGTAFAIDNNGQITVNNSAALDYETNPVFNLTVEVDDGNGGTDAQLITITLINEQPTISVTGAASVNEGAVYTLNLSATEDVTNWIINWGDGTIDTVAGDLTSANHVYNNGGFTNNITVSATDADGTYFSSSLIIGNAATGTDGFLFKVGYDPVAGLADISGAQILNTPTPSDLDWAADVVVGPNGDIYATGYQSGNVVRFDGSTGAFVEEFVTTTQPVSIAFGPDGNLYVASDLGHVKRFNGTTGAYIDDFLTLSFTPEEMTFGSDGNLYVGQYNPGRIYRFDGTTGAAMDGGSAFIDPEVTGTTADDINYSEQFAFGPDGKIYVASMTDGKIQRYDGTTGAFIDTFANPGLNGTGWPKGPTGVAFGPDGHLYVTTVDRVERYDGTTGAYIDDYIPVGSGLDNPWFSTFTPNHQVYVNSVVTNNAPVLDNSGSMTLTAITEDDTTNSGNTVAEIIASAGGDRITDADIGAAEGIAVTGLNSSNGTWQHSIDGGSNWIDVGTVNDTSALLLRDADRLRFVPDAIDADAASVTFRAWDQTSGSAGAKVDASTNGGTTPFSIATESAAVTVTAVNDNPTGSGTISGTPTEDQTLTASNTLADVDGMGPVSYQWQRNGTDIAGATNATYTLGDADVGTLITVVASYTDGGSTNESVASAAVGPIVNVNDVPGGSVSIDNMSPAEGDTLTASNTITDADGISGAISYQWQRNGANIAGATSATYTTVQADVGAVITVVASYTDDHSTPESVTSAGTAAVTNTNNAPTGSVTISGTPTEDQILTASNSLADVDGIGPVSYQWQRNGMDIAGATNSTYTLGDADVGAMISVVASYTDGGSTNESVASAAVGPIANINDNPVGVPVITGTVTEDQALMADTSGISDADGLGAFSYQWLRNGVAIAGATNSTYTLGDADVGAQISVQVSYTDGNLTAESVTSAQTAPVANVNDAPAGLPVITGTVTEDQTLTADTSGISDADGLGAFSYQWLRDGVAIAGATNSTYSLGDADVGAQISVQVSYTDGNLTAESLTSAQTAPVANVNDVPGGSVTIDNMSPAEGDTLTASNTITDADGISGAISYQWQRNGANIASATNSTYTTVQADVGAVITVVASYTDDHSTLETVTSAGTAAVTNTNNAPTGSVTISGTPTEDQTLTASNTLADVDGMGPVSYQWQRNGADIAGATNATYTLGDADVGAMISVVASYTDGDSTNESVASAAVGPIVNVNDNPVGVPVITGIATEDQTLTADTSGISDADGLGAFSYQWLRDRVAIAGATSSTYTLGDADVGTQISVQISYTDANLTAESVTSAQTPPVANVNDAPAGLPVITGTVAEDQTLTADTSGISDDDGLGAFSYQWLRDGIAIAGATNSTYTLDDADVGAQISVQVSYTDGNLTAESLTSAQTAAVANVNDAPVGLPVITGIVTEDQTLTADTSGISDADGLGVFSYQWLRDGVAIAGATNSTYALGDADVGAQISVQVSYTDGNLTPESLTSAQTAPVANVNDAPAGSVTIDNMTPAEGDTLTASNTITDADGISGAISYQWQRDGVDIAGATGSTYTTVQADVGTVITVEASYTDDHSTLETVTSAGTAAVTNTNNAPTGSVTISGTPTEDQTLTAGNTLADIDGIGPVSYQWQRNGVDIAGATNNTYTLGDADVGAMISVVASYTDGGSTNESVASAAAGPIANINDNPVGVPVITGTMTEDQTLTADTSGISDADGLGAFSYQWLRNGVAIAGATNSTYTLGDADVGTQISVQISYTDANLTAESVTSAQTAPVANVNDPAVIGGVDSGTVTEDVDPDMNGLLEVGGSLTIADPDAGEALFNAGVFGGTYGVITLNAAGGWDYAANTSQPAIQGLAAGATLTDTITVSSVDGTTHDINITIMGTNDAPVAGNDVASVNEGGSVIIDVAGSDSDVDNPIDLNSVSITGAPANGTLVINGDGTVTYIHNGSETLSDSFSYTIADISGAVSNSATVTLTVNPVNDAPVAGDDAATVAEGNSVVIDLAANDSDADNPLDLNSVTIIGAPANGALVVNGDGTVTYTHDGSDTTSDAFTYTIADISGAIANTASVTITVTAVNDAPTTGGIADVTVNEDAAATSIDLNAAFADTDNLDSELTYSIVGNTNIGLFTAAGIDGATGQLTLDYAADMNGSAQISIRASDPSGAFVDTLLTVTVNPVNDDPVMQANTGMLASDTTATTISSNELNVTDIDNTNSEVIYTLTALPANGTLLLNGVELAVSDSFTQADLDNNRLVYQADGGIAADQFGFTVSDSAGGTLGNRTFNIAVQLLPASEDAEPTTTETPVSTAEEIEVEQQVSNDTDGGVSGLAEGAGGYGGGFVPFGSASPPPPPAPVLTLEPSGPPAAGPPKQAASLEEIKIETETEADEYELSTFAAVQMKSLDALLVSVDKMKQEMTESAEQMDAVELKVAAAKSSGIVLTAGIVAWAMRGGALLSSLMSTVPLWRGYDPLPILAYEDDDEEKEEKEIDEDMIPTSLEELRKLKELKEKAKRFDVDAMFGGSATRE